MKLKQLPLDGGWRYECQKTPNEIPKVPVDVKRWLASGDTIDVSQTRVLENPVGLSVSLYAEQTAVTLSFTGGSNDERYIVKVLIVTNHGLQKQVTFFITVLEHTME